MNSIDEDFVAAGDGDRYLSRIEHLDSAEPHVGATNEEDVLRFAILVESELKGFAIAGTAEGALADDRNVLLPVSDDQGLHGLHIESAVDDRAELSVGRDI